MEKLATLALSSKTSSKSKSPPSLEPPTKKVRLDKKYDMPDDANKEKHSPPNFSDTKKAMKLMLSPSLKEEKDRRIGAGEMLSDLSMYLAQRILKNQFPTWNGLQSTLLQQKTKSATSSELNTNCLQIIHHQSKHWIAALTVSGEQVQVYDYFTSQLTGKVPM